MSSVHEIRIDKILCKECGICVELCPENILQLGNEVIVSEKCRGCKLCEYYCPDFAIEVF